jgi:UDP-N-acetyl-D-galactosamine dehydrogenase
MTVLTYKASIVKIVERAKVIERKRYGLYILLINKLLIVFRKINIVTEEIIDAAGSKSPRYFLKVLYK